MPYYAELGGERIADIAVLESLDSKFDFAGNGRPIGEADTNDAHTKSVTAVTRLLGSHHLPFTVVGKTSLAQLSRHKVLVLANVNMMDDAEAELVRKWVHAGGCLLATGWTSVVDSRGKLRTNFALADVFGVNLKQPIWTSWPHYLAPAGDCDFGDFTAAYPAFARTTGHEVSLAPGSSAQVLATTMLLWPAPDPSRFASIHSNPPWQPTNRPEIVFHTYGAGRAIYLHSPIETIDALGPAFMGLVRRLRTEFTFEAKAWCRGIDPFSSARTAPLSTQPGEFSEGPAQYSRVSDSGAASAG